MRRRIAEHLCASFDRDSEKIVIPDDRVKTGIREVDEHFDRLVEAINSAGDLTLQEKLEFFSKIPATIGGPNSELE